MFNFSSFPSTLTYSAFEYTGVFTICGYINYEILILFNQIAVYLYWVKVSSNPKS